MGAHKGSFLYWLARAAAPGPVFALEPQHELAEYLRTACRSARLENVLVEEAAASERTSRAVLRIPGAGPAHGASLEPAVARREACRERDVATLALDDLLPRIPARVAAVKIDVEGHELAVLRGARDLLREHRPLLVVEIEQRHLTGHTVRDVLDHLAGEGYGGHFLRGQTRAPLAEFDPARHQRAAGEGYWNARGYCHNFVLTPGR